MPDCQSMGCGPMCVCHDGYVMNNDGQCVPFEQECPPIECPENEHHAFHHYASDDIFFHYAGDKDQCCTPEYFGDNADVVFGADFDWSFWGACGIPVDPVPDEWGGCYCNEGLFRDPRTGKCVDPEACSMEPMCGENEVYSAYAGPCNEPNCEGWGCRGKDQRNWVQPGCICAPGFTRLGGECISDQECMDQQCGLNSHYSSCTYEIAHCCNGSICWGRKGKNGALEINHKKERSVDMTWSTTMAPWVTTPGVTDDCWSWGCTCNPGFVDNGNGECISEQECIEQNQPECPENTQWVEQGCFAYEAFCCHDGVCRNHDPYTTAYPTTGDWQTTHPWTTPGWTSHPPTGDWQTTHPWTNTPAPWTNTPGQTPPPGTGDPGMGGTGGTNGMGGTMGDPMGGHGKSAAAPAPVPASGHPGYDPETGATVAGYTGTTPTPTQPAEPQCPWYPYDGCMCPWGYARNQKNECVPEDVCYSYMCPENESFKFCYPDSDGVAGYWKENSCEGQG